MSIPYLKSTTTSKGGGRRENLHHKLMDHEKPMVMSPYHSPFHKIGPRTETNMDVIFFVLL
jgi:hypothetical protein